jgi:hypothetical protein
MPEIYWKKCTLLASQEGSAGMSFIAKRDKKVYVVVRIMRHRDGVGKQFTPIIFEYSSAEALWEDLKPRSNKLGGGGTMSLLWEAANADKDLYAVLVSKLVDYE